MIRYIDTHCHPQLSHYDKDREAVIHRAQDAKVGMICVGIDLVSSQQAIALASHYEDTWAAVGVHPNDITENFDITFYEALLANPKVVAIGEVGLDYYRTKESKQRQKQADVLKQWLEIASGRNLPVIIHCRDPKAVGLPRQKSGGGASAYDDIFEILSGFENIKGVIHSFTGVWDIARKFIDRGFFIGLNGIITFTQEYDETVINIPLDRILIETDAPFLSPVPRRGERNEPARVIDVAVAIAQKRSIHVSEVEAKTTENAKQLFTL